MSAAKKVRSYPYHLFKKGPTRIYVDEIFRGQVCLVGIGHNQQQYEEKLQRYYEKNGVNVNVDRIAEMQRDIDEDRVFLSSSGSTHEELLARSRFVTDYLGGYPPWLAFMSKLEDKTGLSMEEVGDIFYRFMSMRLYNEDYKEVFETLLLKAGGVTTSDASIYPTSVKDGSYGRLVLDLSDYDLAGFVRSCGLNLDEELVRLEILTIMLPSLSDKREFTQLIRTMRRKVEAFLSLDEMYLTTVVDLPKFKLFDVNVSELIIKCVYDLLSFRQFGDYIDSTRQKNWAITAIAAMLTLIELKNHF